MTSPRAPRDRSKRSRPSPAAPRAGAPLGRLATIGSVLLAFVAVVSFAYHAMVLFPSHPVPWPDEALFADVSIRFLRHGVMGTDLYREFIPGMSHGYYLTPPLYPLFISAVFGLAGVGLVPLRLASLLCAIAVLVLLYALARRSGLGRGAALLPPALLALDGVFLRGAMVGRMDMLTLALVLATLCLTLPAAPPSSAGAERWRSLGIGAMAGLALLAHPMGAAAMVAVVSFLGLAWISRLARGASTSGAAPPAWRPNLGLLVAGLTLCLLPWLLYILRDTAGFAEQFGRQLLRKSTRDLGGACLTMALGQWGIGAAPVAVIWLAGLLGLGAAWLTERRLGLLVLGQLALLGLALPSCEIWYGVYLMPLTYLGVAFGIRGMSAPRSWRPAVGGLFAILAAWFAISNAGQLAALRGLAAGARYDAWCQAIAAEIPAGSRVLMDGIPTPYFGLIGRGDLELRLFPPVGFDLPPERIEQGLDSLDFVLGGRSFANAPVRERVERRGELVGEIGPREGFAFPARIVRLRR